MPSAQAFSTADTSKQDTKDAAAAWKTLLPPIARDAAVEAATNKLLDFLEGRPTTIDGVIAFAQGPAKEMMGEEPHKMLGKHSSRARKGRQVLQLLPPAAASELLAKFPAASSCNSHIAKLCQSARVLQGPRALL